MYAIVFGVFLAFAAAVSELSTVAVADFLLGVFLFAAGIGYRLAGKPVEGR